MSAQGFSTSDLAKPPSPAEIARDDKDFRALTAWYRLHDEGKVAREIGYPNRMAARVGINRAVAKLNAQREDHVDRLRLWYDALLVEMARDLMEAWRAGEKGRGEMILKVIERHSKMAGLEQKDVSVQVGTVVLNGDVSAEQLAAIPPGTEVIDARLPPRRQPAPLVEPGDQS